MRGDGVLDRAIKSYLRKEQLSRRHEHAGLEKPYLAKSRKNLAVANLLFRISEEDGMKRMLSLASGFEMYDWVMVAPYYAMYASALAAIARLGFRSKSHAATLAVLERFYAQARMLEKRHLHALAEAHALGEDLMTKLIQLKTRRETAQYDATPVIQRENAASALRDADEFITRVEGLLRKTPISQSRFPVDS